MKKIYLILVLVSQIVFSNNDTIKLFSKSLKTTFDNYLIETKQVIDQRNTEKSSDLFRNYINENLLNSKFDDFSLKRIGGKRFNLSSVNKSIVLLTYSSRTIFGKGEIQALNKLAKQFHNNIQFIVLFWNRRSEVKEISKKFDLRIKVCYAFEKDTQDSKALAVLKNTLGFPTMYFLSKDLQVIDIQKNYLNPESKLTFKKSHEFYMDRFNAYASNLFIKTNIDSKLVNR